MAAASGGHSAAAAPAGGRTRRRREQRRLRLRVLSRSLVPLPPGLGAAGPSLPEVAPLVVELRDWIVKLFGEVASIRKMVDEVAAAVRSESAEREYESYSRISRSEMGLPFPASPSVAAPGFEVSNLSSPPQRNQELEKIATEPGYKVRELEAPIVPKSDGFVGTKNRRRNKAANAQLEEHHKDNTQLAVNIEQLFGDGSGREVQEEVGPDAPRLRRAAERWVPTPRFEESTGFYEAAGDEEREEDNLLDAVYDYVNNSRGWTAIEAIGKAVGCGTPDAWNSVKVWGQLGVMIISGCGSGAKVKMKPQVV